MIKKLSSYTFALLGLILLFSACKKEYESIQNTDDAKLQQYISSNHLQVTKDSTGFYYQTITPGIGDNFTDKDSVLYNVVVKSVTNGTEYYNTAAYSANFGTLVGYTGTFVTQSIPAIRTAILATKPGGTTIVLLPSYLAFGKNGLKNINVPSNEPVQLTITTYREKSQSALDNRIIQEFITRNSLTAMKDSSGVYYNISVAGTGSDVINKSSTIKAKYTGRLLSGTVFDSSTDGTFTTLVSGVIPGWGKVLPKLTKGSKVRMFIPSRLGYGTAANGSIPANSVLDFDLEVDSVGN
jgi:FKBP-type peptidyl-prolyl cis-trans isomerase FkpA